MLVPATEAPFLGEGAVSPGASSDRNETPRPRETDLGPIELP